MKNGKEIKTKKTKVLDNPLRHRTASGVLLTEKETRFVRLYVESNGERIPSAIEAYDIDRTKKGFHITATSVAYENLAKPHIQEAVKELLKVEKLTDESVDNELAYIINQRGELNPKAKAIEIYNKIAKRYDNTITVKHGVAGISDEDIEKEFSGVISRLSEGLGAIKGNKEKADS